MMRSILAVHPNSPVTRQQGESTILLDRRTFSTLSPKISLILVVRALNSAFSSSAASSPPPFVQGPNLPWLHRPISYH